MKKAYIPVVIIVFIVAAAAVFMLVRNKDGVETKEDADKTDMKRLPPVVNPTPVQEIPAETPPLPPPAVVTPPPVAHFSGEGDISGEADVMVYEIIYDGSSFSPASQKVKSGDIVRFKNNSKSNFQPASDPHPQHTGYPGFDALKGVAPGGSWDFKFVTTGTFGYHDHLHSSSKGTIIVTK